MKNRTAWWVGLMVLALGAPATLADEAKERAALAAAEQWLAAVDQGQYARTWKEAASVFRNAVTQASWEQSIEAVRKPLGKAVSRTVRSASYTDVLPGAPKGEYVVINFDTVFEHRAAAVETVTPMLDADGKWRISGYFIQ